MRAAARGCPVNAMDQLVLPKLVEAFEQFRQRGTIDRYSLSIGAADVGHAAVQVAIRARGEWISGEGETLSSAARELAEKLIRFFGMRLELVVS